MDELSDRLAVVVRETRTARGLSVARLAEASGVSVAMIGKIERGEVQPTAALLLRLSGGLSMTLSELIARAEGGEQRLARRADQTEWTDPDTGYLRRSVSPRTPSPLQLVEVELPAGAEVPVPKESYAFISQQIWVLEGGLRFVEGEESHELAEGDCLQLGPPQPCAFINPTDRPCRYLVALVTTR